MKKTHILLLILLVIVLILTIFFLLSQKTQETSEWQNIFPFKISDQEIEESIMSGETIIIKPFKISWRNRMEDLMEKNNWQLIGGDYYDGGGSFRGYYFKSNDKPLLVLFYTWDLFKGQFDDLTISFIPADEMKMWFAKNKNEITLNKNFDLKNLE